jgi:hypothetical protein
MLHSSDIHFRSADPSNSHFLICLFFTPCASEETGAHGLVSSITPLGRDPTLRRVDELIWRAPVVGPSGPAGSPTGSRSFAATRTAVRLRYVDDSRWALPRGRTRRCPTRLLLLLLPLFLPPLPLPGFLRVIALSERLQIGEVEASRDLALPGQIEGAAGLDVFDVPGLGAAGVVALLQRPGRR